MKFRASTCLLLAAFIVTTFVLHPNSGSAQTPVRRIEITAKRFAYFPAEITLKKGEPVVLVMHSSDVAHGIEFKELGLSKEIDKNKTSELAFTPTKIGDFVGHCSRFCGSGHGSMILTLHVTE
jgi:cytochrome c oxidase subunit II